MRAVTFSTVALAAAVVLLTGCHSAPSSTGSHTRHPATPTVRAYDVFDCKALLERNYEADQVRDASDDPECNGLTRKEYQKAVAEVLTGHKEDFLDQARNETAWEQAWERTSVAQQQVVCDRLAADGATVVGQEMMDGAGTDASGNEIDMAQYFLDEKC